jgi:hypothetical protein
MSFPVAAGSHGFAPHLPLQMCLRSQYQNAFSFFSHSLPLRAPVALLDVRSSSLELAGMAALVIKRPPDGAFSQ